MSADPTNTREFTRVPVALEVELWTGSSPPVRGTSRDVSMTGIYVATSAGLPAGTECRVVVRRVGQGTAAPIEAKGIVVRLEPGGMAVYFTDLRSAGRGLLRKLIRLGAADSEVADLAVRGRSGGGRRG